MTIDCTFKKVLGMRNTTNQLENQISTKDLIEIENEIERSMPFKLYNPTSGQRRSHPAIFSHSKSVQAAIVAHIRAKFDTKIFSMCFFTRAKKLNKFAQLLQMNQKEAIDLVVEETGKPIAEATSEVKKSIEVIQYYASEKLTPKKRFKTDSTGKRFLIIPRPIGVVLAICPFNQPIGLIVRKFAPALAAGCSVIVKPSEKSPQCALFLQNLAVQAGFDDGEYVTLLTYDHKLEISSLICDSPIDLVSFTGSEKIGQEINSLCAKKTIRVVLELGGTTPFIVLRDANLDLAENSLVEAKFRSAGQNCLSPSVVYCHESVYSDFSDRIKLRFAKLEASLGTKNECDYGPLISISALNIAIKMSEDFRCAGYKLLYGGNLLNIPGYFFSPTLFEYSEESTSDLSLSEIFAPILILKKFSDENKLLECLRKARGGLGGFVFGQSQSQVLNVANSMRSLVVGINQGRPTSVEIPFSGSGNCGLGSESGQKGIEEFLELQAIAYDGFEPLIEEQK